MSEFLTTPIEFLKGVGPQKAELLKKELNIFSYQDLLLHFPFRYIDRSFYHQVADLPYVNTYTQLKGRIVQLQETGIGRSKKLIAKFQDATGVIDLIWFQNFQWIKSNLKIHQEYQIFGRPKIYGNTWNIPHPEMMEFSSVKIIEGFQPVYHSTEKLGTAGLHSKGIEKIVRQLIEQIPGKIRENLPQYILNHHQLMSKERALIKVHYPLNEQDIQQSTFRLKFEELFYLQTELLLRKQITATKSIGGVFKSVGNHFLSFYEHHLPFELTGAQKRVLKDIRKDVHSGHQMNRLIQGDVGSGKTLVALLTMLLALDNGCQAAMMAPTEILATQHYVTIKEFLKDLPIEVALLTGSTRVKARRILHEGLQNGKVQILIGTHALIEDTVQFQNLGMVIIDEQHRFGVAQRAKLRSKNTLAPHILIMTATPIPRTLAMTFYGDLDVSTIDELPPGRKPITTIHRFESHRLRLFGFMKEEIAKGRQIYVVYPLIQESEKLDYNNLMQGYEAISRAFPMPTYQISMVHGKLKPEDKEFEMQRFVKGETHIMVATTVIEVGVNVPNASVMIIESAERFGLSQLHQLRGRVGRGAEKSYCILMTGDKLSKESQLRMETMVETNDGFKIAEVDLKLRGPGDIMGTQQSGDLNLKIADLSKDGQIVMLARDLARQILAKDPSLTADENQILRHEMINVLNSKPNWGSIG